MPLIWGGADQAGADRNRPSTRAKAGSTVFRIMGKISYDPIANRRDPRPSGGGLIPVGGRSHQAGFDIINRRKVGELCQAFSGGRFGVTPLAVSP